MEPLSAQQVNSVVSGAGGKGATQTPRKPKTDADSLNSTQYVNVIDLISEGEIEGLVDGYRSIFFNNTALQNADGSYNFQDVEIHLRSGTQTQLWIPLPGGGIEDEKPVGIEVLQAIPIVRTVTDTQVDAVRVTIAIPSLQRIDQDNGDTLGTSVTLKISVQYAGGGYTDVITDTISGRTADEYRKQYIVPLSPRSAGVAADVKVTRLTADSTDSLLSNKTIWSSYTEIIYAKLRYPNSALVGIRVNAQQFNSIPQRSYLVKGIKVQIPAGVTVDETTGRIRL